MSRPTPAPGQNVSISMAPVTIGNQNYNKENFIAAQPHYLDAINSIALISSLLFGFAVTIWYQVDLTIFEKNNIPGLELAFNCCLSIVMALSGYSVVVMIAYYYLLKILAGLTLIENRPENYQNYKCYLIKTKSLRLSCRASVITAFLGLIFTVILYNVSRYSNNDNTKIFEIITNTLILCTGLGYTIYQLSSMEIGNCFTCINTENYFNNENNIINNIDNNRIEKILQGQHVLEQKFQQLQQLQELKQHEFEQKNISSIQAPVQGTPVQEPPAQGVPAQEPPVQEPFAQEALEQKLVEQEAPKAHQQETESYTDTNSTVKFPSSKTLFPDTASTSSEDWQKLLEDMTETMQKAMKENNKKLVKFIQKSTSKGTLKERHHGEPHGPIE